MTTIELDPDRLLPPDPERRGVARRLYAEVADLPIVSAHGHVDPALLAEDRPFEDPAGLFVTPDHYVTRLLHANGVPLADLGVPTLGGATPQVPAREIWRRFCENWTVFRGTPSRYWIESALVEVFGVSTRPSAKDADNLFDELTERFGRPEFRPRALFERFGVETMATTDDPCSDLAHHSRLRDEPGLAGSVIPTFRPDAYLDPGLPGWAGAVGRLGEVSGRDTGSYTGYVDALQARRDYFRSLGGTATDHGMFDASTTVLDPTVAEKIYSSALAGNASAAERDVFRQHMLVEMARMSAEDGLVMQLHPGVLRGHHGPSAARFGPDTGHDIPVRTEFTAALRPLLERHGTSPTFRLVLYTVDETTWSRELAPLAGFYPSVYVGVPWWFLDTPDAMLRFRAAVTDTAGFAKTAGFVDDTRAFCSIPVRHDTARRVDCSFLAGMVADGRLDEDEAAETARDLAYGLPRRVFRLG